MFDPNTVATIASILGINAVSLWRVYRSYSRSGDEELEKERLAGRFERSLSIIERGLITKVLRNFYSREDLATAGLVPVDVVVNGLVQPTSIVVPMPFRRIAVPLDDKHDTYELVSKPGAAPVPDTEETARLLDSIERRGVKVWNDPVYSLAEADFAENTLRARFYLDQFYSFRFGIGALEDEVVDALIDADLNAESVGLSELPLRSRYLPSAAAVSDLRGRLCVGGLEVVLALAHEGQFIIPLQKRARNVSDGQSMLSVLPKAFHQPLIDPVREIALSRTVYRELYEELLGGTEAEKTKRRIRFDWYEQTHPAMKWFADHRGAFQLECVCFGINLTKGGFEYGILLAVPDEKYWRDFGHELVTNWEVLDERVPLLRTHQAEEVATMLTKREWTGESLFTLAHDLTRLKTLYPDRVTLPELEIAT
jgi:hypothetical protein